ncbi:hypothetical protein LG301_01980 [Vreelandella venusta]|uniref:hypothetical protein n=1 Tax=Vreelandella venusta TaxID=44935 RepID=UPI00384DE448
MNNPIIPMSLENKLCHGENDFAEMCAWSDNVRQLRQFAELMTDLAADCVIERRKGEANMEHAYARARLNGHRDLARELVAMVARLSEMEREAAQQKAIFKEEYELARQVHLARARGGE